MRVSRVSEVLDAAIRSAKTVPGVTTVLGVTQDSIGDKIFTDQLDEVRNLKGTSKNSCFSRPVRI